MIKKYFFLLAGIISFSAAQEQTMEIVEFQLIQNSNGEVECVQIPRDQEYAQKMSKRAEKLGLHILKETVGRKTLEGANHPNAVGLDIVLRATTQLEANPAAKQAFINAAARWENILMNPVTVTIDVDYGTTRFGEPFSSANVLGSTSSAVFTLSSSVTMTRFADSLKARNPGYSDIYSSIPNPLPNSLGSSSLLASGTLANLQALGFRSATDALAFGSAPAIGFNSAFTFDLDPSNGISGGQTDFDGVAVHEIGHALGFVSVIGSTGSVRTWDIFRFRPGVVKDTATFKVAERILTPGPSSTGGDHVFWDGTREWELSTATGSRTGGDGQQASHWRDDALRGSFPASERKIGIMDPTLASGVRDTITLADIKALSIMGWIVSPIPYADAPSNFTAISNHTTPNSIKLTWKNPRRFFDGRALTSFKVLIFRDGTLIQTIDSAKINTNAEFIDNSLTQYKRYTYRILAKPYDVPDSGIATSVSFYAGGSPYPERSTAVSITSNGSTVVLKTLSPSTHDDKTVLHNLDKAFLYRGTYLPSNRVDSIQLSVTDTSKIITFVDTPPAKFNSSNAYNITFSGSASSLFAESAPLAYSAIRSGAIQTTAYTEGFEVSKASAVADFLWDSTNVAAHTGTYSIGALNYSNNTNASLYIPLVKGGGSPVLRFWTVCRTEAGKDFGNVEVSRNRGKNWETLASLSESDNADWTAGNNVWVKKEFQLTNYATDTILVRFRLTSDGANTKFGWLIDDIELTPVLTSVENSTNGIPTEYMLSQNFPNPFNPSTRIHYAVKEAGIVTIKVYDILGKEIQTLVQSEHQPGWYGVNFNASALSGGMYIYQIRANNFTAAKKLMLVK